MRKILLLLIITLIIIPNTKASHVVGGDFHIQWVSANNFHIKLRVYRDDVNGISMPTTVTIGVYNAVTHAQVATQTLNKTNAFTLVPLGDPCYTPDPNVVRIEEGIFESPVNLVIPNNPNGYYIQSQINARNSLAINVTPSGTMSWFAMMPDPAIGPNSSPDFDDYPNDAYFCVNSPKLIQYPITDADGDSLAYSLVQPLDAWTTSNGTFAGSGLYPFYPPLTWQAGYSLANIIGGATPMSIDATTGVITAAPAVMGFFTFAIRVEEFRDTTAAGNGPKVKIGETRRDVQYTSFNCTSGNPPSFLNLVPTMGQTIQIPYNKEYCKDLIFNDLNATDTLYIEMISPIFDSGAYVPVMVPDLSGNHHYYYNWNGTAWVDSVVISPNQFDPIVGADWNIGTVANRFCWTPACSQIGEIYPFQVNAFSLGCDGKTQDSVLFNIEVVPPPLVLDNPGTIEAPYGIETCVDLSFYDTTIVDMLDINITSDIFSLGAEYPNLANNYLYNGSVITNVPNDAQNTVALGSRFCWTPDCEHIGKTYGVRAILSSVDCPEGVEPDTINFDITVVPPYDSLGIVPNVITPNGDGLNDYYKISGVSNPCEDQIKVQIFNRWGLLIFEVETNPTFDWDGKNKSGNDVPAGTYFVLIHGIYGNEIVTLDQRTVTILR